VRASNDLHNSGALAIRKAVDIVSVTMPLLSIKTLQLLFSTREGPAEDDPPLYKQGSKPAQAVCREWSS